MNSGPALSTFRDPYTTGFEFFLINQSRVPPVCLGGGSLRLNHRSTLLGPHHYPNYFSPGKITLAPGSNTTTSSLHPTTHLRTCHPHRNLAAVTHQLRRLKPPVSRTLSNMELSLSLQLPHQDRHCQRLMRLLVMSLNHRNQPESQGIVETERPQQRDVLAAMKPGEDQFQIWILIIFLQLLITLSK